MTRIGSTLTSEQSQPAHFICTTNTTLCVAFIVVAVVVVVVVAVVVTVKADSVDVKTRVHSFLAYKY